jgi:hypothetical protein
MEPTRFITVHTRSRYWSLSWARIIESMPPHHIFVRPILILSSDLHLYLASGIYPTGFPTRTLYEFVVFPCLSHSILYDFIILVVFGKEHKLRISLLCSFLQLPIISSHFFFSNILLNTFMFSSRLRKYLERIVKLAFSVMRFMLYKFGFIERELCEEWSVLLNIYRSVNPELKFGLGDPAYCHYLDNHLCYLRTV